MIKEREKYETLKKKQMEWTMIINHSPHKVPWNNLVEDYVESVNNIYLEYHMPSRCTFIATWIFCAIISHPPKLQH
jgi:hypothetical protein